MTHLISQSIFSLYSTPSCAATTRRLRCMDPLICGLPSDPGPGPEIPVGQFTARISHATTREVENATCCHCRLSCG
jgi:hypothetical protein